MFRHMTYALVASMAATGATAQTQGTFWNEGLYNPPAVEEEPEAKKDDAEKKPAETKAEEGEGGFWNENLYAQTEAREAAAAAEAEAAKAETEAANQAPSEAPNNVLEGDGAGQVPDENAGQFPLDTN